jgi:alkylation response protein AidB-like acyl-CoA dehydrogenase
MSIFQNARGGFPTSPNQRSKLEETLEALLTLARSAQFGPLSDTVRQEIAERAIEVAVLHELRAAGAQLRKSGRLPVYAGSMLKVFSSDLDQRIVATAMKVIGPYGMMYRDEARAPVDGMISFGYVDAVSHTIRMGTSEIQRNVIATRGLGLQR